MSSPFACLHAAAVANLLGWTAGTAGASWHAAMQAHEELPGRVCTAVSRVRQGSGPGADTDKQWASCAASRSPAEKSRHVGRSLSCLCCRFYIIAAPTIFNILWYATGSCVISTLAAPCEFACSLHRHAMWEWTACSVLHTAALESGWQLHTPTEQMSACRRSIKPWVDPVTSEKILFLPCAPQPYLCYCVCSSRLRLACMSISAENALRS